MRPKRNKITRCRMWFSLVCCATIMFLGYQPRAQALEESSELELPPDPISFQQGPGSNIASTYCLICHSAEYIYTQPPHPHEKWTEIIKKMKHGFGCPIPDEQISPLAQYLVNQNMVQPFPIVKKIETEAIMPDKKGGNSKRGQAVYNTHCLNCHGQAGKGDGPIGKALVPPAADLTATGNKSEEALLKAIRDGRPGTAMPSWKNNLTLTEVKDVLAYIRLISK